MSRAPSFCAVILAAGESLRMGRDKALLPWPPTGGSMVPGDTFLSSAIRSLASHADMVIVVAGKNAPNLLPVVFGAGAELVMNPAPERGQFSSLQAGLREVLRRGRDAAMITHVDRPAVGQATIRQLHKAFETAVSAGKWAVVPEYGGKHGHPILIGRELLEQFLKAPVESTARDVEHMHTDKIEYVPVEDPLVVLNVNTPEDYAALCNRK